MLTSTKEVIKETIKEKLNNKNWSIICERLYNYVKEKNLSIEDIERLTIYKTTDSYYLSRYGGRKGRYIGCRGTVYKYKLYIIEN